MKPRVTPNKRFQELTLEERRDLIATQRLSTLKHFNELRRQGKKYLEAAQIAGASIATICRWGMAFSARSFEGLKPKPMGRGHRPALEQWKISAVILMKVQQIMLQKKCSVPAAWRQFALMPDCPANLSARLLRSVPPSLCRAISNIPSQHDNDPSPTI